MIPANPGTAAIVMGIRGVRMAQKVLIQLVDDLDEGEADETVSFGLDGTDYEIDLSKKNAAKLRDALAPYVGAGRKASRGRRGRRSAGRSDIGPSSREIRDWARSNGYEVSERGRIPAEVREAFEKAQG